MPSVSLYDAQSAIDFTIPDVRPGVAWHVAIDTFDPAAVSAGSGEAGRRAGEQMRVGPRSVLVLQGPRVTGA